MYGTKTLNMLKQIDMLIYYHYVHHTLQIILIVFSGKSGIVMASDKFIYKWISSVHINHLPVQNCQAGNCYTKLQAERKLVTGFVRISFQFTFSLSNSVRFLSFYETLITCKSIDFIRGVRVEYAA